ncbi:putative basic proline-rich protein-like [Iris pallida]|uniref:Basic proline-rich protein-like n=1 Tax=Iris pallida TaxID=29817 RepID=A0AAX6DMX0_IRIPA|nr:putative basic proline-rich protein-like [Iris pallida]
MGHAGEIWAWLPWGGAPPLPAPGRRLAVHRRPAARRGHPILPGLPAPCGWPGAPWTPTPWSFSSSPSPPTGICPTCSGSPPSFTPPRRRRRPCRRRRRRPWRPPPDSGPSILGPGPSRLSLAIPAAAARPPGPVPRPASPSAAVLTVAPPPPVSVIPPSALSPSSSRSDPREATAPAPPSPSRPVVSVPVAPYPTAHPADESPDPSAPSPCLLQPLSLSGPRTSRPPLHPLRHFLLRPAPSDSTRPTRGGSGFPPIPRWRRSYALWERAATPSALIAILRGGCRLGNPGCAGGQLPPWRLPVLPLGHPQSTPPESGVLRPLSVESPLRSGPAASLPTALASEVVFPCRCDPLPPPWPFPPPRGPVPQEPPLRRRFSPAGPHRRGPPAWPRSSLLEAPPQLSAWRFLPPRGARLQWIPQRRSPSWPPAPPPRPSRCLDSPAPYSCRPSPVGPIPRPPLLCPPRWKPRVPTPSCSPTDPGESFLGLPPLLGTRAWIRPSGRALDRHVPPFPLSFVF